VIIATIEFEGTSVVKEIELMKVRKFLGQRNRSSFWGLAIENVHLVPIRSDRGCKIGQPDRLGPNGGLIEILDGWLDEKDLHRESDSVRSTIMK
jgi:hypothetical protein